MSYIILLSSLIMFVLYFALKFVAYRTFYSKRPTFRELRKYGFENNVTRGRNAKAFKYVAILLLLFGIVSLLFTPNISTELRDRSVVMTILKMLLLLAGGVNFMARNVLYEEGHKGNTKFVIPILEIFDVFRKTQWLVSGKDAIAIVVNVTTIAILIILIGLFYTTFFA